MFFDMPRQLEPRSVGQTDIQNNQIPEPLVQLPQSALLCLYPRHVIILARQPLAQSCAERTIVFHQQQTLHNSPRTVCATAGCAVTPGKLNSATKPSVSPR